MKLQAPITNSQRHEKKVHDNGAEFEQALRRQIWWMVQMPVRQRLVGPGDRQDDVFVVGPPHELNPRREPVLVEAVGDRYRREPGPVPHGPHDVAARPGARPPELHIYR